MNHQIIKNLIYNFIKIKIIHFFKDEIENGDINMNIFVIYI